MADLFQRGIAIIEATRPRATSKDAARTLLQQRYGFADGHFIQGRTKAERGRVNLFKRKEIEKKHKELVGILDNIKEMMKQLKAYDHIIHLMDINDKPALVQFEEQDEGDDEKALL